ncbi:MAG: hypothetical protein AB1523_11160 [Bacillota bacterium]
MDTDEFSKYYAELLDGTYDCVDRIIINGYYPMLHTAGGFRLWWRLLNGSDEQLDDTHLMRMAGRFSRCLRHWAEHNQVPIVNCQPGERKHELAEKYLPSQDFVGIFLVIVAKSSAPVWNVKHFKNGTIDLKKKIAYVNHYYFHILDPDWGHLTIKISGHPPFGAMVMLNGHEWVERQAKKQGLEVGKEGNCFVSNVAAVGGIADTLNASHSIGRLSAVCDRWIYSCLCFALNLDDQKRSGFLYRYSVYQIEYSRNLLFQRGRDLEQVYQRVIDLTRNSLDIRTIKTIFSWKRRSCHRQKRAQSKLTVEKPMYNLTVFKVHFGKLTLKMYDKGDRVLRIEAVAHNTKDLHCGKVIVRFADMVSSLKNMTIRFLNVLQYAHFSFLDEGALDDLPKPTCRGKNRVAGIDINNPRMRAAIEALMPLALKPDGFSVSDLAAKVQEMTGWNYGTRQAAYDLIKIKGKGFVEKQKRSRRYLVSAQGFQTMCALLILQEKSAQAGPCFDRKIPTGSETQEDMCS